MHTIRITRTSDEKSHVILEPLFIVIGPYNYIKKRKKKKKEKKRKKTLAKKRVYGIAYLNAILAYF